jgi:hypothetical protein
VYVNNFILGRYRIDNFWYIRLNGIYYKINSALLFFNVATKEF